jgi:hypothetical protein
VDSPEEQMARCPRSSPATSQVTTPQAGTEHGVRVVAVHPPPTRTDRIITLM